MFHHHNRFLNTMGLCRILHDVHMFCFIHLVENHPKNHYLIIIIFSSININSTYAFLLSSKPVSPYPSSPLRSRMWNGDLTTEDRKRINSRVIDYDGLELPSDVAGEFSNRNFQNWKNTSKFDVA